MSVATPSPVVDDDPSLNRLFSALADPTRRSILTRLTTGEATMSELAEPFEMSLPGVSKHVSVLEDAGLVRRWRTGRVRRCRLEPEALEVGTAWIAERTRFWNETLDRFAAFVENDERNP